jgi:hypothetical protein
MSPNAVRPRLLVAAVTVLLVAACGSGTTTATPTTTTTGVTSSTGPVTTTPGTPTSSDAPVFARCTTKSLRIALGSGNGGAGHYYVPIIFTNAGGTCAISGYPGVSYVAGADEHQVGDAAAREPVDTPMLVLRNGESVSAWVNQVNVDNFDPAVCGPVSAAGLRVYPPDNTDSVVLPEPSVRACANHLAGQDQLTVRAVQIGTAPN